MHQEGLAYRGVDMFATVQGPCICSADTLRWRNEAKIDDCLETFLLDDKDNKLRRFLPSGFVGLDKTVSIALANACPDKPVLSWQQYGNILPSLVHCTSCRHREARLLAPGGAAFLHMCHALVYSSSQVHDDLGPLLFMHRLVLLVFPLSDVNLYIHL